MPIQLIFSGALINGPMLSDLTFREAQIWVQTDKKSKVSIHYFEKNNPSKIFITPKIETKRKWIYCKFKLISYRTQQNLYLLR